VTKIRQLRLGSLRVMTLAGMSHVCQPMHDDYDLRQEQMNKASILSTKKFLEGLLEMFTMHVVLVTSFELLLLTTNPAVFLNPVVPTYLCKQECKLLVERGGTFGKPEVRGEMSEQTVELLINVFCC